MKLKLLLALVLTSTAFATNLGQAQLGPLEQLANQFEREATVTEFNRLQFPERYYTQTYWWYTGYAAGLRAAAGEARQLQMVTAQQTQPLASPTKQYNQNEQTE